MLLFLRALSPNSVGIAKGDSWELLAMLRSVRRPCLGQVCLLGNHEFCLLSFLGLLPACAKPPLQSANHQEYTYCAFFLR